MNKNLIAGLSKRNVFIFLPLLILVVSLTYSNHFNNSFHFDDSHTIENNLFIRDLKNIPLFFKDGTTFSSLPSNQSYRPIVSASLAIDYWLGNGYNLFYFHLSSFLFFVFQGILMFFFIFKLFDVSYRNNWNFFIAALAATWYLVHPANAETVNYIISRSDIQSTFCVILAFVLYVFSPFCKKTFLYLIPIGIGALAKPPAVMFVPMLFFYILFFEEKIGLNKLLDKQHWGKLFSVIKALIPAFVFCAIAYKLVDHLTPKTWVPGGNSTYHYLITQPYVIFHYFITFFLPTGLSADTDWQTLDTIWHSQFFIGCFFILLMLVIAYLFSKEEHLRPISFGIIWFFLALIPTSSIIPLAEVMNDHRVFFPYVGLVISVCWTLALIAMKHKKRFTDVKIKFELVLCVIAVVGLSVYAYGTRERNKVWRTEESLWYDVTIKSPKNPRGLMNYGLTKMAKGEYSKADRYFTKALSISPDYSYLNVNMGVLKAATGDKVAAEKYFKHAIDFGATNPNPWFFYGKFLFDQSRFPEAITNLVKVIELSPAHVGARFKLMSVYHETGDWEKLKELAQGTLQVMPGSEEAEKFLKASENKKGRIEFAVDDIKLNPSADKYLNLSLMYYQVGKYQECIDAANEALKLKPDYAEAYNNIGSAYNILQKYDKAIEACKQALKLKPDFQLARNNMLAAINSRDKISQLEAIQAAKPSAENYLNLSLKYYNQGAYEKCIDACKQAIKLKPDYADAYSNMGVAYIQLKQYHNAINACEYALKINPKHKLASGNLKWAQQEKLKVE